MKNEQNYGLTPRKVYSLDCGEYWRIHVFGHAPFCALTLSPAKLTATGSPRPPLLLSRRRERGWLFSPLTGLHPLVSGQTPQDTSLSASRKPSAIHRRLRGKLPITYGSLIILASWNRALMPG